MGNSNASTISLSVNLNKIALIRNSRDGDFPSVERFGQLCIDAGVGGLTVHPRPDLRHIHPKDVYALSKLTKQNPGVELNVEGNPEASPNENYPGLMAIVEHVRPTQCTLVPDTDGQKTSDHGFDLKRDSDKVAPYVEKLRALGVRVSLFMDPDVEQIALAKDIGADRIELYTGPYAWAYERGEKHVKQLFDQHCKAAECAQSLGLGVNAGHDLNLHNMLLYKTLPGLAEVSIGHGLTVDSLLMGFNKALKAYLDVCR
ncbi:MAG: pyridoxine 5'-phosphate synthase [Alteromonadaceae bacterium]|nr:MAG: pyridoxine 5'-phosphate synthase [Alteromonadaceae bacterium]